MAKGVSIVKDAAVQDWLRVLRVQQPPLQRRRVVEHGLFFRLRALGFAYMPGKP